MRHDTRDARRRSSDGAEGPAVRCVDRPRRRVEDPPASRRALRRPRGRPGGAALPAHAGPREARRSVRRPLPDHRLRPEQLRELRPHEGQGPHAVQVELAHRAHHPHLAPHVRHRAVRRPRARPDAARPALVPRHGRRRLPEPRPRLRRGAVARLRVRRGPHLRHGHQPDARVPRGRRARPHDRGVPRPAQGGLAFRDPRGRRRRADPRLRGEAGRAAPDPRPPGPRARLDGKLRVPRERPHRGARARRPAGHLARFRQEPDPGAPEGRRAALRLRLLDEPRPRQRGPRAVLAGRRDRRLVLGRVHGPHLRDASR